MKFVFPIKVKLGLHARITSCLYYLYRETRSTRISREKSLDSLFIPFKRAIDKGVGHPHDEPRVR